MICKIATKPALGFVAASFLIGCVPSELVDVGGRGNPNVDDTILLKEGSNGKFGYVDRNGKWLIAPQFASGTGFTDNIFDKHDGEAQVQLWGIEAGDAYIDKSGKIVSRIPSH